MKWLVDEMFPREAAGHLNQRGHDAVSVFDVELASASDREVFIFSVAENRVVVTEDVGDYSHILNDRFSRDELCVPVVFVLKSGLPHGGAPAAHLAAHLDRWAAEHPHPDPVAYWA